MPLDDRSFWDALPGLHGELTAHQWDVLQRMAEGNSNKQIAKDLGRGQKAVVATIKRAGEHIFDGTPFEPTSASLGAWYHCHMECCGRAG